MGAGGGGVGGIHTPLVPQRVNLFKLSHLQFAVNTLAATYLLGFFSPKINSRKSSWCWPAKTNQGK